MVKSPEGSTGVSTLNRDIQRSITERDDPERYRPSNVVRIINRATEDSRYKKYDGVSGLRKGHFIEYEEGFHDFQNASVEIDRNGKKVTYEGLLLPSSKGKPIIEELDKLVEKYDLESLSEEQLYTLLSLMAVSVGSAHAFPDGTGRSAVGLVDIYMRKYLGKKLDLEKLEELDDRLTQALTLGTLIMYPGEYGLNANLAEMSKGDERELKMPNSGKDPINEVAKFAEEFADNIIKHIQEFDINAPEEIGDGDMSLYRYSIEPLSELFEELALDND